MLLPTKNFYYFDYSVLNLLKFNLQIAKKDISNRSNLIQININRGLGKFSEHTNIHQQSIEEFRLIFGQHPKLIYAKKSIAGFKLRENVLIGLKVTLRKERMYSFLDKLIHLALPQISDFKGLSKTNFDSFGNYNFGITDQSIFPEIDYNKITEQLGFNITFVFLKKNNETNLALLNSFGFPFS